MDEYIRQPRRASGKGKKAQLYGHAATKSQQRRQDRARASIVQQMNCRRMASAIHANDRVGSSWDVYLGDGTGASNLMLKKALAGSHAMQAWAEDLMIWKPTSSPGSWRASIIGSGLQVTEVWRKIARYKTTSQIGSLLIGELDDETNL